MKAEQTETHSIVSELKSIITGFVLYPDSLSVQCETKDSSIEMVILPHAADYPIICGRHGRTINALVLVAKTAGEKAGLRIGVKLEDSFKGKRGEGRKFVLNPRFDVKAAMEMIGRFCKMTLGKDLELIHEQSPGLLVVHVEGFDKEDEQALSAINELFYVYGGTQGMKIKILVPDTEKRE